LCTMRAFAACPNIAGSSFAFMPWEEASTFDRTMECARDGGQFAGWELTGAAGLSEDESHGQAPHP